MCVHNLLRFREVREVAAYWEERAGTPSIIIAQTAHDDKADHYVGSRIVDMAVAVIGAESILRACAIGCWTMEPLMSARPVWRLHRRQQVFGFHRSHAVRPVLACVSIAIHAACAPRNGFWMRAMDSHDTLWALFATTRGESISRDMPGPVPVCLRILPKSEPREASFVSFPALSWN